MTESTTAPEIPEKKIKHLVTPGQRLKRTGLSIIQRRTPNLKWQRAAIEIENKYSRFGFGLPFGGKRFEKSGSGITNQQPEQPEPEPPFIPDMDLPLPKTEQTGPGSPGLPLNIERSGHALLDERLTRFMSGLLHLRIPAVKIYANSASHALTKAYDADALTVGDNILFRSGKYTPWNAPGLALLGHELTHAAQAKMESQGPAETPSGSVFEKEERQALANEQTVLRHVTRADNLPATRHLRPAEPVYPLVPRPTTAFSAVHRSDRSPTLKSPIATSTDQPGGKFTKLQSSHDMPSVQPKAAASNRDLELPLQPEHAAAPPQPISDRQLDHIKEEVYRDLMQRIRTEFERGG